jgi:uncharacterized protein HemX
MAIWPFRKKQSEEYEIPEEQVPVDQPTSNLPEEVQEYYESGQKERVGVAWLLGLGTLLLTILIAVGLFFGGRWVYQKVTHKDEPAPTSSQTSQSDSKSQEQNKSNSGNNSGSSNQPQGSSPAPSNQNQTTPPQSQPSQSQPAPTPTPAPATGSATPNTGPGDVFAIALFAAIVGSAAFYAYQLKRQN